MMLLQMNAPSGPVVVDGALVQYRAGEVAGFSEVEGRVLLERLDAEVRTQEDVDAECSRKFLESEARRAAKTTGPTMGLRFALQTLVEGYGLYGAGETAWFPVGTVEQIEAAGRGARV